ncbi:hypothetical protein EYC80_009111 [Monilinia laxa]|uniref:Uncharacterized protein n=1 Tax=Monilinia laxa TaxID=61186 RepID=A0A5N6K2F6_MONLA|nr:hypothetical protein EYC80_009111 [Monilinia laxa]
MCTNPEYQLNDFDIQTPIRLTITKKNFVTIHPQKPKLLKFAAVPNRCITESVIRVFIPRNSTILLLHLDQLQTLHIPNYCEKLSVDFAVNHPSPYSCSPSFPKSYNCPSDFDNAKKKRYRGRKLEDVVCECSKVKKEVFAGYRRKVPVLQNADEKQCNRTSHRNKNVEMKNYFAQNLICATS